ncbi:MAG: amidase [Alphaproteobacteria bacterium]|nr:amidase [Alphaproteobacteria bacterium]
MEIATLTATELLRLYRARKLSPVEVVKDVQARIDRHEPVHNAFAHRGDEDALAWARASEARWMKGAPIGLVDGIPTTIKDQWPLKGWPWRKGSRTSSTEPAGDDAPAVARLREHGAVFLGKTTMPEFGWKGTSDSPLTGFTRNPWNPAKTAGGSSSGAGVCAALNLGVLHHGSDGAGSVRMPATFCGVFGHKPTFARVPAWPYGALPMQSHTGPLTRTVADAALMMNVMTGPDHRDWLAPPPDGRDYRVGLDGGVQGLRVAFSPTLGYVKVVQPDVAAAVRKAAEAFAELGAIVEECDPGFADPREAMERWYVTNMAVTIESVPEAQRPLMDPGYLRFGAKGRSVTGMELARAWLARDTLGRHMNEFHTRYDLLLTPSLPIPAFDVGHEVPPGSGMTEWLDWSQFHYPFNFTQQPAAVCPCGFTRDGLPVGLQIVGARHADALVLQAARAYESIAPFKTLAP